MAILTVDASAIAALLFGEAEGKAVAESIGDAQLVAPSLIRFELANVCLMKIRRHPEQRALLRAAFELRDSIRLKELDVDHAGALCVAEETGLTAYDACYLWLARQLDTPLVTLDRQLAAAAGPYARA